jgi:hypothetical protein
MKCSFCKTETSDLVKGPADYSICYNCIQECFGKRCNFCNQIIGARKGAFKTQTLLAARIANEVIMCNECLQRTSQMIVANQEKAA